MKGNVPHRHVPFFDIQSNVFGLSLFVKQYPVTIAKG